jgi:hypothetical protein
MGIFFGIFYLSFDVYAAGRWLISTVGVRSPLLEKLIFPILYSIFRPSQNHLQCLSEKIVRGTVASVSKLSALKTEKCSLKGKL